MPLTELDDAPTPAMWVAIAVFVLLVALTVAYFVHDRRRARATAARWEGWTGVRSVPVVVQPPADDATEPVEDPAEATRVIPLPSNRGRHAAPMGVARVPVNMPRLRRRRDGSVKA